MAPICIKFFEELITEISEPIKGRSFSQTRKIAVGFRDEGLGKIFTYCLYLLHSKVQNIPSNLLASLLNTINLCMNFDFLGISSDDINEDNFCLQVPVS